MKRIMTWIEYEVGLTNARYGEDLLFIPFCERDFIRKMTSDKYAFSNDGVYQMEFEAPVLNYGTLLWTEIDYLATMVKVNDLRPARN